MSFLDDIATLKKKVSNLFHRVKILETNSQSGGTVSNEQIATAVASYLQANPPSGLTTEQATYFSELQTAVPDPTQILIQGQ